MFQKNNNRKECFEICGVALLVDIMKIIRYWEKNVVQGEIEIIPYSLGYTYYSNSLKSIEKYALWPLANISRQGWFQYYPVIFELISCTKCNIKYVFVSDAHWNILLSMSSICLYLLTVQIFKCPFFFLFFLLAYRNYTSA